MVEHFVNNLTNDKALALHIGLFKNVKNINELLNKKIQENAAFIDASLIISLNQLLIAFNKTLEAKICNELKLSNFYTELLYNVSFSKNITETLKTFGIEKLSKENSSSIVVLTIDNNDKIPQIFKKVDGTLLYPSDENIKELNNLEQIKKIFHTDNKDLIESKIASKFFLN